MVLDDDDYTERLHFYVRQALQGAPLIFKRSDGQYGFVKGSEIPLVLAFILENKLYGPLNISSIDPFSTAQFLAALTAATKQALRVEIAPANISPFSHYDTTLDVSKLQEAGYAVTPLASWLPSLMRDLTHHETTAN